MRKIIGAEDRIRTGDPHLGKVMLYQLSYFRLHWSGKRDSNPRPTAWEAVALPTELFPLSIGCQFAERSEDTSTSNENCWWAKLDLNQRPPACEAGALAG